MSSLTLSMQVSSERTLEPMSKPKSENGFIEIMEYPRAWEAKITDASTGESEIIKAGDNADALAYELADMERAINGDASAMHLDYTKDVMDLMTSFRRTWGYTYPEEEK